MLGLLLAFSSPVGQSSIRVDVRLWRKLWEFTCRSQFVSQIHNEEPNLLMDKSCSAELFFVFYSGRGCLRALDVSPHDNLIVFHCFDSMYTPLILAAVGGEKSTLSSAEESNLSSVSMCGHNYTESCKFFLIPSVCLDTSQPASSFLLCLFHSLQVHKLDSFPFFATVKWTAIFPGLPQGDFPEWYRWKEDVAWKEQLLQCLMKWEQGQGLAVIHFILVIETHKKISVRCLYIYLSFSLQI